MRIKIGFFQKLRLILTLIGLLILLPVLSILTALIGFLSLGTLRNFLVKWVGYILGRSTLAFAGVKLGIRYHGKKPEEPAVFLFNHSSTLDLFIIISVFLPRIRFIAKKELMYNPFFFIIAKATGQIMIDRKKSRSAVQQIYKTYDHIRSKRLSLVFAPEGTRSETGEIRPFKPGAFHTAVELGYPVVPIYIEGAYELCPGKSLITRSGTVTVHFHEPIDTSEWDKKNIRTYKEEVRDRYLMWSGQQKRTEEPEQTKQTGKEK